MSLINFVKKEEINDYMMSIASRHDEPLTDEAITKASEALDFIVNKYNNLKKDENDRIAANFVAACLAVMLLSLYNNGFDPLR